jgi:hypothetical protein
MDKINKAATHLLFVEEMTDTTEHGKKRVAEQFASAAGWFGLGFSYDELVARARAHVRENLMQG